MIPIADREAPEFVSSPSDSATGAANYTASGSPPKNGIKQLTVASFFSGAGGLDLGFEVLGFRTLFASDIMRQAAETYLLNNPGVAFIQKDICLISPSELISLQGEDEVDVVIGGPPCQGFSNMGNKNSSDPRNYLFEAYARALD